MIQITPQVRSLVALEPADFRQGIDGLARLCKQTLQQDPFSGGVFVFRNRRGTALWLGPRRRGTWGRATGSWAGRPRPGGRTCT